MISERVRNTLVGLTMILALLILMYGILLLGKTPSWGGLSPYTITLVSPNANGVGGGTKVDLNGVLVGQVKYVSLRQDKSGQLRAFVYLQIDGGTDIPASATASLGKQQLGTPYVSLSVSDARGPLLPKDGSATLPATAGESGLIPKDIRDSLTSVAAQLTIVARDLHTLLAYNTPEAVVAAQASSQPDKPVDNISTLVIRLNRTMKSLETLLTDPALQSQVRTIAQNLADASARLQSTLAAAQDTFKTADSTIARFGQTAQQADATLQATQKQILRVSEQLVTTLNQIEATTRQITQGNGTTGKLINDPRLYEGLIDLSKSLRSTVDDLDFLLKKWKDEGVNLHLK